MPVQVLARGLDMQVWVPTTGLSAAGAARLRARTAVGGPTQGLSAA